MRNSAEVDPGPKQMDRGAVTPTVRMKPFSFQRRYPVRGLANMLLQDPAYSKPRKWMTTAIVEHPASFLEPNGLMFQVFSQRLGGLRPKWTNPFLFVIESFR